MRKLPVLLVSIICLFACSGNKQNQLTEQEKKDGWISLFDGISTKGWHLYNKGKVPSSWTVDSGQLICRIDPLLEHDDLLTDNEYENYDLKFDWKISKGGNSGVFINVIERKDLATAWRSGPEYQILDSANVDYAILDKRSGCLYGFQNQLNPVNANPSGQWNHSEIKQQNGKIEFYLNGILTAKEDFTSQAWKDTVSRTYFKDISAFGKATKGYIALQDWHKEVAFKNIRIKPL